MSKSYALGKAGRYAIGGLASVGAFTFLSATIASTAGISIPSAVITAAAFSLWNMADDYGVLKKAEDSAKEKAIKTGKEMVINKSTSFLPTMFQNSARQTLIDATEETSPNTAPAA